MTTQAQKNGLTNLLPSAARAGAMLTLGALVLVAAAGCTNRFRSYGAIGEEAPPPPVMVTIPANEELSEVGKPETESRGIRLNNRGMAMARQGRHDEALDLYQAALGYLVATNPSSAITRAATLNNMGVALASVGNLEQAQPVLAEALQIRQQRLGHLSPQTLLTQNNLSAIMLQLGDLKQACILAKAAFKGRLQVLGQDHPDTIVSRSIMESIQDCDR